MPRHRRGQGIVRVPFHVYVSVTCSSNIGSVNLSPDPAATYLGNYGTRLAAISDAFEFYRFTKVRIEIPPHRMSSAGDGLFGYAPVATSTSPTTFAQIAEMPAVSAMIPVGLSTTFSSTTRTIQFNVPKRILLQEQVPWLRTRNNAAFATEFEQQGTFWFYAPVAAGVYGFMVHGVIELKGMLATSLTTMRLRQGVPEPDPPTEPGPMPVCLEPAADDGDELKSQGPHAVLDAGPPTARTMTRGWAVVKGLSTATSSPAAACAQPPRK